MKTLIWNCKGLGNPRIVRAFLRLARIENPKMVFLMETKLKDPKLQRIRLRCDYNHCLSVDCNGEGRERAGGLSLMWKDDLNLTISSYSLNHIGIYFEEEESNEKKNLGHLWFP